MVYRITLPKLIMLLHYPWGFHQLLSNAACVIAITYLAYKYILCKMYLWGGFIICPEVTLCILNGIRMISLLA